MLREPRSVYAHGRSHQLLKVKSFHDEEGTWDPSHGWLLGVVVRRGLLGVVPRRGRHVGPIARVVARGGCYGWSLGVVARGGC